ncbi:SLAM family member 9-like [Ascaphus truei]|uniref:SLAM family member 9-like n=1 Tax=Ascaphus truei TaxID=8439 RepID=UPI003F5972CB
MILYFWSLIFFFHQKSILCDVTCGDIRHVVGREGGDVTLQVDQTAIKDISWVQSKSLKHIATTKPDVSVDIRDRLYKERLYSWPNASLHITHLTSEDQGTYTADIRSEKEENECTQLYDLRVYKKLSSEDINIHHQVTGSVTCNVTLTCTVSGPDVTRTWYDSNSREINVTNHTLHVYNPDTHRNYTCTARNPVSYTSRTVIPWKYCEEEGRQRKGTEKTRYHNYIIFVLLAVPAGIVVFLIAMRKKRKNKPTVENLKDGQTIYAQVQKQNREDTPGANTAQENVSAVTTLYSEVQLPKNQKKMANGTATHKKEAETLYDVVQDVKCGQNLYQKENKKEEPCYDVVQRPAQDILSESPRTPRCNSII